MEIIVLGIDHSLQMGDVGLESLIRAIIESHNITLIAEENRGLLNTIGKRISDSKNLRWLQIDMSTEERITAGIYDKLANRMQIRGYDADGVPLPAIRYAPVEDGIREEYWLSRIEETANAGTTLVICGCLHGVPLSAKGEKRGHRILARMFYPENLSMLKPELY